MSNINTIVKNTVSEPSAFPLKKEKFKRIAETTTNKLIFNVMPEMHVEENLYIKEYRVGEMSIDAVFNRSYKSTMIKSPSHLIFLSALVHMQKMLYVYMCHRLELKYDSYSQEILKVWPTGLEIKMPKLVTKCEDIVHHMDIIEVKEVREKVYFVKADSNIEDVIDINGTAMVFIL